MSGGIVMAIVVGNLTTSGMNQKTQVAGYTFEFFLIKSFLVERLPLTRSFDEGMPNFNPGHTFFWQPV